MNKKRLEILAKLMDMLVNKKSNPKFGFNMHDFVNEYNGDRSEHNCKTNMCLGGWAVAAFDRKLKITIPEDMLAATMFGSFRGIAKRLLGLSVNQADMLFLQFPINTNTTPASAAKVLRHLAKTGVVDWGVS